MTRRTNAHTCTDLRNSFVHAPLAFPLSVLHTPPPFIGGCVRCAKPVRLGLNCNPRNVKSVCARLRGERRPQTCGPVTGCVARKRD